MATRMVNLEPDPDAAMNAAHMADPLPDFPADATLEEKVTQVLQTIYDPEIPVDIHALGLIYRLDIDADGVASIDMTLTSPACPVAGSLPGQVCRKVEAVPGISAAKVQLVWDPPWTKDRISEAAQLELGLF